MSAMSAIIMIIIITNDSAVDGDAEPMYCMCSCYDNTSAR